MYGTASLVQAAGSILFQDRRGLIISSISGVRGTKHISGPILWGREWTFFDLQHGGKRGFPVPEGQRRAGEGGEAREGGEAPEGGMEPEGGEAREGAG